MSNISIPIEQKALVLCHLDDLAELLEALDASSTTHCVSCGEQLSGFFGTFQWDIIHGHGSCSGCGFPYVYYHRHQLPDGELLLCAWVPNADVPLAEPAMSTGKAT